MAGIMLGGLLMLAPTILQTAVQITQIANPTTFKFSKNEYLIIRSQFCHLMDKVNLIASFLNLEKRIEWIDFPALTNEDETNFILPKDLLPCIFRNVEVVSNEYELYLNMHVIPDVVLEFYSGDYADDHEMKFDISKHVKLHGFPLSTLEGSSLLSNNTKIDRYVLNNHINADPNLACIVDKLIDDSMLALSRVSPLRLICPTNKFCILPYRLEDWLVSEHPLKSYKIEKSSSGWRIYAEVDDKYLLLQTKYLGLYEFRLECFISLSRTGTWFNNSSNFIECKSYHSNIVGNLVTFDVTEISSISDYQLDFRLHAALTKNDIMPQRVAELHSINSNDFTFGRLLVSGNYEIRDPYFSIASIVQNTIGSSQFSIQTSITILVAWLSMLCQIEPGKQQAIHRRYLNAMGSVDLEDLCAIGNKLIKPEKLKNTNIGSLSLFWRRLLLDIAFMKKYVLRSKASQALIATIISCK